MIDEDKLNMQVRKFLKEVGVTSQREIEKAVQQLDEEGKLPSGHKVDATMTLRIEALDLEHRVEGTLDF